MAPPIDPKCIKFNLPSVFDDELNEILNVTAKNKVCVVSVVGRSSLHANCCKTGLIDEVIGRSIFKSNMCDMPKINTDTHCDIRGYYDPESQVIFLHLTGIFDASYLTQMCKSLESDLLEKSFLELWCDLQCKFAKALLLMFSISHIILISHPTATFDVNYIYLFRTLDVIRQKAIPILTEQLRGFNISNDWIQAARPCSPRVLFLFQSCPLDSQKEVKSNDVFGNVKSKKISPIKKLEHALEDQIYRILRKSRVITNISGNSLFAVPANQEFVYVSTSKPVIEDPVGFFISQLRDFCSISKESETSSLRLKSYALSRRGSMQNVNAVGNGSGKLSFLSEESTSDHSFHSFLWQHIQMALTKGFDDNVGRHPIPAYFELPSVKTWFEISNKLYNWFLSEPKESRSSSIHNSLRTALDIDVRFSEGRCGKVLPIAAAAYQENLPPHYTTDYHQRKLAHALQVFSMHARGPAFQRYAHQLREDCERLWHTGHQMCEILSLTGNQCLNPAHRVLETKEDDSSRSLPIMPHCSQIKLISACDCGRRQASRDDPFTIKAANHEFYVSLHKDCCGDLERIDFRIFQATIIDPQSDDITSLSKSDDEDDKDKESGIETNQTGSTSGVSLSFGQTETSDNSPGEDDEHHLSQDQNEKDDADSEVIISIDEGSDFIPAVKAEKPLIRQPSTTEYLPGMINSESPSGLLPKFSSWSLVCLGPSSLYSHNIGIQDQPGFIPATNFLLPWDVTVKLEQRERWPTLWEGKRSTGLKGKKGGKDGSQFTVKIFIGVEYECPRGHRFMCSGPDRVLRATSSGLVKDNANKVTGNDMPLYFPCPCRSSKPQIAQLMRIHVVTPKAPVHVTLNPKVQPAALPCPIFYPGNAEPVKLSQSAYWVLRLPFVYQGEQHSYLPPKDAVSVEACRLLKGTYNIAEQVQSMR
ncbi:nonsense-mediated mRNA decay factor SMG8 isoform X1 [Centruroides vittatus]|uniref:nonsense-mediated mRNA decay factor SMG8 isoform X1 n=1 Tax=Centruroides vittatus TaxID=120091 RepID=UPI00350F5912